MTIDYAENAVSVLEEFVARLEDAIEAAENSGTHTEESLRSLRDILADAREELRQCEEMLTLRDALEREALWREYERGLL